MRKITDTTARVIDEDGLKIVLLTTVSGQELETRLSMFAGGSILGISFSSVGHFNFVDTNPPLNEFTGAILMFENLDGVEVSTKYLPGLRQTSGTVTESQMQYLATYPLDHIALIDKRTNEVIRYCFGDTPNRLYKDKAEGQQLLMIMAQKVLEQKKRLADEKAANAEDIVQFSRVS